MENIENIILFKKLYRTNYFFEGKEIGKTPLYKKLREKLKSIVPDEDSTDSYFAFHAVLKTRVYGILVGDFSKDDEIVWKSINEMDNEDVFTLCNYFLFVGNYKYNKWIENEEDENSFISFDMARSVLKSVAMCAVSKYERIIEIYFSLTLTKEDWLEMFCITEPDSDEAKKFFYNVEIILPRSKIFE